MKSAGEQAVSPAGVRPGRGAPIDLLRAELEGAGPIATSFGKYLSSRLDLLHAPDALILSTLAVPESIDSFSAVSQLINSDLDQPIDDMYLRFDREPFDATDLFLWHRAMLPTGEAVSVKVVRPALVAGTETGLERLARLRQLLEQICGPRIDSARADFDRFLHQSLDLRRDAENSKRTREESTGISDLVVPTVIPELSGKHCLTLATPPGSTAGDLIHGSRPGSIAVRERYARRLCRSWLRLALSGAPILLEPCGRNVLLLENGKVAFCGGPAHEPMWGDQDHLRSYLVATGVEDHKRIRDALLEMVDERSEEDKRRLLHKLRHSEPFRDGRWDPGRDRLVGAIFAHWRGLRELGYRPRPTLLAFFRGLFHLSEEVQRLAPGERIVHESLQELRLRELFMSLGRMSSRGEWTEIFRRQANLFTELPQKVDRLLSLTGNSDDSSGEAAREPGNSFGSWAIVGALLAAVVSLTVLTPRLASITALAEPIAAVLTVLLGALLLAVAYRA